MMRLSVVFLALLMHSCVAYAGLLHEEKFHKKLEDLDDSNVVVKVSIITPKSAQNIIRLQVEQAWPALYSGGFHPFDVINVDCKADTCEHMRIGSMFFVILGKIDDELHMLNHLKSHQNGGQKELDLEKKVHKALCHPKTHCRTEVAAPRYEPDQVQKLSFHERRRISVLCPGSNDVDWYFRYPTSDIWESAREAFGMRVSGNKLKSRGVLITDYDGMQYECRNRNTQNTLAKFTLNVEPESRMEFCHCKNGGICIGGETCVCPKRYHGMRCEVKVVWE